MLVIDAISQVCIATENMEAKLDTVAWRCNDGRAVSPLGRGFVHDIWTRQAAQSLGRAIAALHNAWNSGDSVTDAFMMTEEFLKKYDQRNDWQNAARLARIDHEIERVLR